jgi:hypothetical protein
MTWANLHTEPHTFRAVKHGNPNRCYTCGGWADHPCHNLSLWDDVDRDREAERLIHEAGELSDVLRTPLKDVSRAAGILERESPLFFGSGSNPSMF